MVERILLVFSLMLTSPAYAVVGNVSVTVVETITTINDNGTVNGSQPLYCDTAKNGDITCYF